MAVKLSEKELADLKDGFAVFDQDHDGKITSKEIEAVLKAAGINVSEDMLNEIIKEADADKNGVIDFDEFVALMTKERE
ncbi:calmodulin-A-like protein [Dinothrombium tinctorium]|uniref:Calmodulin-A-like protein n=1 Tax=Dinothrombium tinctorium TaxID=1965070 RepID=A0A3S3RIS0_9ACAR|nr:calmodulin-A-like protein [Dinothrombium tinctorium]